MRFGTRGSAFLEVLLDSSLETAQRCGKVWNLDCHILTYAIGSHIWPVHTSFSIQKSYKESRELDHLRLHQTYHRSGLNPIGTKFFRRSKNTAFAFRSPSEWPTTTRDYFRFRSSPFIDNFRVRTDGKWLIASVADTGRKDCSVR